jgi:DmsE family decaheme c-type cytochrome
MKKVNLACSALAVLLYACLAFGAENCSTCHTQATAELDRKTHSQSLSNHPEKGLCTACHGQPENHPATNQGLATFSANDSKRDVSVCIDCHTSQHRVEVGNPHQQAGITCTGCHTVHEGSGRSPKDRLPPGFEHTDAASAECYGCHEDTFAQFAFSERHRLAEGSVGCTDCHDPHDSSTRRHLGGFTDLSCDGCHADKNGPYVFEHAATRVDGCAACHVPHGSPNRHLLTHQRVGELCYGCHAVVPQFHLGFSPSAAPRFDLDTVCTNCHVTIHGSNLDRNFLR